MRGIGLVVAVTTIVLVPVVAAVTVAIGPGTVVVVPVAARDRVLDALLEPGDANVDVVRFVAIQAVARGALQPILQLVRFTAQAVGLTIANAVAAVELLDLPLHIVDAHLQGADLAPIVLVAISVAVGRRVLRGRRGRERKRGS